MLVQQSKFDKISDLKWNGFHVYKLIEFIFA